MVKILANGDLVPDDDPRAAQSAHQRSSAAPGRRETNSNVHSTPPPQADAAYQAGQTTSVFDSLNQRLVAAGVPSWNIGSYVVEPIVSVGFLLALIFMGFQGLLFAVLLFFVVKYSGMGGQGGGTGGRGGASGGMGAGRGGSQGQDGTRSRGGAFSGAGHRLGQS